MKMDITLRKYWAVNIALAALAIVALVNQSAAQTPSFRPTAADLAVMVDTNGVLLAPTNFFSTNAGLVKDTNALHATNNLADLASATTARANLGLGTAATASATAFQPASTNLTNWAAVATNQVGMINASQTWSGIPNFSSGITLPSQSANVFLAGPTSGSAVPVFRALNTNDITTALATAIVTQGGGGGGGSSNYTALYASTVTVTNNLTVGSVTVNTNISATNGTVTAKYLSFAGTTGTPTVAVNTGAGSGATASIVGNDVRGTITFTTGTTAVPSASVVDVTFSQSTLTTNAFVQIFPINAVAALNIRQLFSGNITTNAFSVLDGTGGLPTGSTFQLGYFCGQ